MEPWMQKHTLADWRDDSFRKKRYFGSGRHVLLGKHCILRMQEDQERIHVNKHQSPSISLKSKGDKVRHVCRQQHFPPTVRETLCGNFVKANES